MRSGLLAWAMIVLWEYLCPPGSMLCEVLDPVIRKHPVSSRLLILYTALHMANLLSPRHDVYYQIAVRIR